MHKTDIKNENTRRDAAASAAAHVTLWRVRVGLYAVGVSGRIVVCVDSCTHIIQCGGREWYDCGMREGVYTYHTNAASGSIYVCADAWPHMRQSTVRETGVAVG